MTMFPFSNTLLSIVGCHWWDTKLEEHFFVLLLALSRFTWWNVSLYALVPWFPSCPYSVWLSPEHGLELLMEITVLELILVHLRYGYMDTLIDMAEARAHTDPTPQSHSHVHITLISVHSYQQHCFVSVIVLSSYTTGCVLKADPLRYRAFCTQGPHS